jgi:hypothetical protein
MPQYDKKTTPIRRAVRSGSPLQTRIEDGLAALQRDDRRCLSPETHTAFGDSLDLDAAYCQDYPQEPRWDYLLGHTLSEEIVGLEPHSARTDEISNVINKRKAARQQPADHLRPGARVSVWLWVASGKVHFADTEKARRRLDENGITFVGNRALPKHLPNPRSTKKR